jgi:ubiquinone/menaquinone biosynthesis C-methylase UbiE
MCNRIYNEQAFHDQRFSDDKARQKQVGMFYRITNKVTKRYRETITNHCLISKGIALEYGCGTSSLSLELARKGAKVVAIDISQVALKALQIHSEDQGNHILSLMNGECMAFEDNSFDLVYGSGILHHLDLSLALREIQRVLRPGGKAIFIEPLGNNIFINAFRTFTPNIRTIDEHPLTQADFVSFQNSFHSVQISYFYLMALAAAPFMRFPFADKFLSLLEMTDNLLFKIPKLNLKNQAWIVLIELSNPCD